jgi:hypothetical protein
MLKNAQPQTAFFGGPRLWKLTWIYACVCTPLRAKETQINNQQQVTNQLPLAERLGGHLSSSKKGFQ